MVRNFMRANDRGGETRFEEDEVMMRSSKDDLR